MESGAGPTRSTAPGQTPDPNDLYVSGPFATPATPTSRINVLLTGVDSAENRSHALTDTLLVASVDPVTGHVALVSFPRDITDFPLVDGGTFKGKINSFMTYVGQHPKEFKGAPLVELVRELSFLVGVPDRVLRGGRPGRLPSPHRRGRWRHDRQPAGDRRSAL